MVRLAIRVDPPTPLYGQLFVIFWVTDYDYMSSETSLRQENAIFIQQQELPILFVACLLLLCHKMVR